MKLSNLTVLLNRPLLRSLALLGALVCVTPTARAGDPFNIDFGVVYGTPRTSYGGIAGQTGIWNKVGIGASGLFKATGTLSGTTLTVVAETGTGTGTTVTPITPDELLLNDNFFTSSGNTWSATFTNLADGDYLVVLYASSNPVVPTGAMTVGQAPVASIPGALGMGQIQGVTWTSVPVTVTGGTLPISGSDVAFSGLAGVQLLPITPAFASYCTAGTTASGCQATLRAYGQASASFGSGFFVAATNIEGNKDGVFFQGTNGSQANSWGSGTSFQCVVPPVKRLGVLPGTGTNGACDGFHLVDFNQLWSFLPAKNPGAGNAAWVQFWFRDPFNTSNQTTSLSDAIVFVLVP